MRRKWTILLLAVLLLAGLAMLSPAGARNEITPAMLQARAWVYSVLQTFGAGLTVSSGDTLLAGEVTIGNATDLDISNEIVVIRATETGNTRPLTVFRDKNVATSGSSIGYALDNSAGDPITYGSIGGQIVSNVAGSETGLLDFATRNGASMAVRMTLDETGNLELTQSGDGAAITLTANSGTRSPRIILAPLAGNIDVGYGVGSGGAFFLDPDGGPNEFPFTFDVNAALGSRDLTVGSGNINVTNDDKGIDFSGISGGTTSGVITLPPAAAGASGATEFVEIRKSDGTLIGSINGDGDFVSKLSIGVNGGFGDTDVAKIVAPPLTGDQTFTLPNTGGTFQMTGGTIVHPDGATIGTVGGSSSLVITHQNADVMFLRLLRAGAAGTRFEITSAAGGDLVISSSKASAAGADVFWRIEGQTSGELWTLENEAAKALLVVDSAGGVDVPEDLSFGSMRSDFLTFGVDDSTPSVADGTNFKTANAGVTITDFQNQLDGQVITVIFGDANTTIDCTANVIFCNSAADWTPGVDDSMRCVSDSFEWWCDISDN